MLSNGEGRSPDRSDLGAMGNAEIGLAGIGTAMIGVSGIGTAAIRAGCGSTRISVTAPETACVVINAIYTTAKVQATRALRDTILIEFHQAWKLRIE